jgi:hypothetical protein
MVNLREFQSRRFNKACENFDRFDVAGGVIDLVQMEAREKWISVTLAIWPDVSGCRARPARAPRSSSVPASDLASPLKLSRLPGANLKCLRSSPRLRILPSRLHCKVAWQDTRI